MRKILEECDIILNHYFFAVHFSENNRDDFLYNRIYKFNSTKQLTSLPDVLNFFTFY